MRYKVKTEDTMLMVVRVINLEADSKEELLKHIKTNFPNSKVLDVEEVVEVYDEC